MINDNNRVTLLGEAIRQVNLIVAGHTIEVSRNLIDLKGIKR